MNPTQKRSYLIVDGHSMIHAWPDLRSLHHRLPFRARDELSKRLTAYSDLSEERVVLVFDGSGERISSQSENAGIQIFYADKGHTADDIIERLVAKYASSHDLTVATNDLAERMMVSSLGAFWISADGLGERLGRSENEFRRLHKL